MLRSFKTLYLLFIVLLCNSATAEQIFGSGADKSKLVSISDILATPQNYLGKDVTISGKIDKVCKKKGCWMTLYSNSDTPSFRVKVKDGVMIFPLAAIGKTALATGKVHEIKMSLAQTKKHLEHHAEEQQESFDPNLVNKPMTLYQLVPHGVTIY